MDRFIIVGENIHCTRSYKVGGKFVQQGEDGQWSIPYASPDGPQALPVPDHVVDGADWESGKVKHCAVAIWQGNHGADDEARARGVDYLQAMARRQEAAGAAYLDINVDEFSTDVEERVRLMQWTVDVVQQAVKIPVSVDSSNEDILKAGLDQADTGRDRAMVNSVSLERADAIELAAEAGAVVVASAAGEHGLPSDVEGRLVNLTELMSRLKHAGFEDDAIHFDPLVFPISVDGSNGNSFLDSVAAVRETFGPEIHIVAGLSNVSFGMPKRKLINQVFSYLAVQRGADGGIVNPAEINAGILAGLDVESEAFKLTRALLVGEDDFGMNFIAACREGTL